MVSGTTYHIYTHANGSENLFRSQENFRYFLKRYEEYIDGVADTFAYCLMPNHLHLLVRIKSTDELVAYFKSKNKNLNLNLKGLDSGKKQDLSGLRIEEKQYLKGLEGNSKKDLSGISGLEGNSKKDLSGLTILQFSHLFNAYCKSFNKVYKRRGSLFIRSFRRKEITSDHYFTSVIYYIHNNPVQHGFVKQITEWPWSSYNNFLFPELTPIQQEVIDWFGSRQQFILFLQQPTVLLDIDKYFFLLIFSITLPSVF
jgi:REP element-mobilizing transposase RayT